MKRILCLLSVLFCSALSLVAFAQDSVFTYTNNKVKLQFSLTNSGAPEYAVFFEGRSVIRPSRMGFKIAGLTSLENNFIIVKTSTTDVDETWKPVWGEVNKITNKYHQLTVQLKQNKTNGILLNIVFRIFEDGVGFKYEFPLQPNLKFFNVTDELTQFNLTGNHKTFWIPGDFDSNEYPYTISPLSEVDAWKMPIISNGTIAANIPDQFAVQTPLMLKTSDSLYINIHEAALVNYPSMQLHVNTSNYSLSTNLVPDGFGTKAYLRTPAKTPWRTIIVSNKATDILASKMILNLNEPTAIKNTSWIKPMKFVGVWWEMQTGKSSWDYTNNVDSLSANGNMVPHGHHAATTANVKHYIDFASRNGIKGLLVEGWNKGWEEWTGVHKEENFDYVTPYPDFDVKAIQLYAKQKGVQMIMHNETGGSAVNFEKRLDTSFRFMKNYGYNAVKTGYVGKIFPMGEHHDGQWMINHYVRVADKAAQYQIMVDMHEPVRPTGLSRTYPNWMACEAGRGNEWNAFSNGNNPNHETIMPFTRLMGGPMDYTPGIFKLKGYAASNLARQVHTTLAKQLALYVTMYSPIQMAADIPENYEAHMNAFQFIKDVPVDWDDTKILEAEPGAYITIARKEKGTDSWFIGAITNENKRQTSIDLTFLEAGKTYLATFYEDAADADWQKNPEAYTIQKLVVGNKSTIKLFLSNGGGAAVSIIPTDKKK